MRPGLKIIQDQYEILEEIGRGGMATVYKARQLSLGRIVAIKEIKPAYAANPELIERFKREARIAASLVHENIIQVYNFGEPKPGELFIVMEHVEGSDLRTILKTAGIIPPRIAAIIGRMVAQALGYAHARGLVHRDVKPGNIMLSTLGDVKLMDFGIVRERDSDLTATGAFLGTPSYMAPEQFLGEEITPACDLFSLGVVLYEILAGQKPFKADNETSLAKKIRTQRETPLRALNPEVPRRLQAIVHQCLAKNPLRRHPAAHHLARQLDKFLGRMPGEELRQELAAWYLETVSYLPLAEHDIIPIRDKEPESEASPLIPPETRKPKEEDKGEPRRRQPKPAIILTPSIESPPGQKPPAEDLSPIPPAGRRAKIKELQPENDEEEEAEEGMTPGALIIKWLWRAILLAIALLAALIMFLLYPGLAPTSPDHKSFLHELLPDSLRSPK